jgi:hypothetical protein
VGLLRACAAAQRITDRPHHVERLRVAELPCAAPSGRLAGGARRPQVVLSTTAALEVGEHMPQGGTAQTPQRLRAERHTVVALRHPTLPAQLALQLR